MEAVETASEVAVWCGRPVGRPGGPPSSPGQPAFNLHVWADRFERRPRSARQPLASITGRASSQVCSSLQSSLMHTPPLQHASMISHDCMCMQSQASQMSRDERPETDPIDFSLLAAMDSRGLGSQPFPVPCTQGTQASIAPVTMHARHALGWPSFGDRHLR